MAAGARDFSRYKQAAQRFTSGFSRGQQAVTVAAVIGVVVVAMVFMSLSGRPTYAMLFTNLQPSDAAAITQQLATNHVPYELENGGSTILVPQNMVDQERLAAAAAGLPSQTTVGLSILDKEGLTTSQLTQQADYLQALQGELEQTIDSISGVTSSQVSIALPANQTFALGNTNPTGASVLVDLQPGHSLTYGQVQAIVSLTASAVPGLNRSDVTVADSNGNLLAGPGVNDSGAAQSSASTAYDSAEQARISAYLAGILGPGNADVQVNAQLNFDQVQTRSQTILAGKGGKPLLVCTSTQQSSEKYTGTGTPAGLQAGTTTAGTGSYTQTSTSKTCESGTQSQTVTTAPGGVTSQSVAVLVNSKALPKGLTLAQLQAGVAATAGIQKARGDVLSFSAAPFKASPSTAVLATKKSILATALKPGLALLLVLLVLFLLWRASRKARKAAAAEQALLDSLVLDQLESMPMLMEPTTGELPAIELTPARRRLGPSIQELVDNQSDEVASVLRDWLHQGT